MSNQKELIKYINKKIATGRWDLLESQKIQRIYKSSENNRMIDSELWMTPKCISEFFGKSVRWSNTTKHKLDAGLLSYQGVLKIIEVTTIKSAKWKNWNCRSQGKAVLFNFDDFLRLLFFCCSCI